MNTNLADDPDPHCADRMRVIDSMPKRWRAFVREHGDVAVKMFEGGMSLDDAEMAIEMKRINKDAAIGPAPSYTPARIRKA